MVITSAIITRPGSSPGCPIVVNPMQNFDVQQFSGVWYEIQKYSSQFDGGKCVSVNFGSIQRRVNQTTITISYSQRIGSRISQFNQNATVRQMNSVWSVRYNRSIDRKVLALKLTFFS